MRRNLKTLGLALVAVFALSAVAASAASATEPTFTSGSNATTLTGSALTNQSFHTPGKELAVVCESIAVDNASMGTDQTEITVPITFGKTVEEAGGAGTECSIVVNGSSFPAIVHTNGCHLLFTSHGTVHIVCPTEKEIEVKLWVLGAFRKCLDIPTQTPTVPNVDYTNGTKVVGGKNYWDVTIKSTVEGVTYTKTGTCGTGTFNDATYEGEATVTGEDGEGNPIDVTWDA